MKRRGRAESGRWPGLAGGFVARGRASAGKGETNSVTITLGAARSWGSSFHLPSQAPGGPCRSPADRHPTPMVSPPLDPCVSLQGRGPRKHALTSAWLGRPGVAWDSRTKGQGSVPFTDERGRVLAVFFEDSFQKNTKNGG